MDNAGRLNNLRGHRVAQTVTRMVSETIQIVSEHPKTVPKGLGSVLEGSGMSRNHPGRSRNGREWPRKVPKASGRFRKFLDSTTHCTHPLAWGGKPPGLAQVGQEVGAHQRGAILLEVGLQSSLWWDSPVGKCPFGSRSPKGTPTPLRSAKGPPGHLYNEGQGWGRSTLEPQGPYATPPPSKPRCSTFRPRFRRCSRSESVRIFSL